MQYHRVETNLGVVCQSIHSSISISISEGSISKSLLSQLTPTNAILPSHTRWGISSSLKQIQDILWFFKVPSKHAFCEPETWKIHFVSTLTFQVSSWQCPSLSLLLDCPSGLNWRWPQQKGKFRGKNWKCLTGIARGDLSHLLLDSNAPISSLCSMYRFEC